MDERKMRGSQIPGFGNWDYVNELPITQYFECARQAGLIRYNSSSSGECGHTYNYNNNSIDYEKPRTNPPSKQAKGREKRTGGRHVKVTEVPQPHVAKRAVTAVKKKQQQFEYDAVISSKACRAPKAVDEDLYKIPPELLKRKRRLGFFSRCLVPPCAV